MHTLARVPRSLFTNGADRDIRPLGALRFRVQTYGELQQRYRLAVG